MGRRLLVASLLVLVALAAAAAAAGTTSGWWQSHVGADPAQAPGPGVPIYLVDSGLDTTHPQFAGRPNTTLLNQQTTFGGKEWHGTAVASAAVSVYPSAVLDSYDASPTADGITTADAATGVDLAAQHCPAVISLSFGSGDRNPDLEDAIVRAQHAGCLVVASAGNVGQTAEPVYPAALPHVFTVGATDENDTVSPFSIGSGALDVVAPGTDITVAVPTWENGSGYETQSGTSFAAPIAAAAAAWVWTLRPTLTAYQLAQVLRAGATDLGTPGFDTASGYGLLSIPRALAAPAPPNDPNEPNDDIAEVKPGQLFSLGTDALTTAAKPSAAIAGTLDGSDDPRDVYRIWIPARRVVRVSVSGSGGAAAARIWGPKTVAVGEGLAARRRDLRGPKMVGGKRGVEAYVEVLLTGLSSTARYTLSVTAAKR